MASTSAVTTPTNLLNLLPVTDGVVTINANTLNGSLVGEILSTFNGGAALQIATNTVPALLTDGITINGTTPFLGSNQVQLTATFKVNGDFTLSATIADLTLASLTSAIKDVMLPHGMGTVDLGTVQIIAAHADSALTLTAAASNATLGEFAFKAQKSDKWGAGVGFEAKTGGIAALPGLKTTALAQFDSFIGLSNLLMVLSSFDSPDFDFPDVVSFDGSSFTGAGKIALPGSGGLKKGFNIFAQLSADPASTNGAFSLMARKLHINLEGMSATLSVSLPDPVTSTQLFFSVGPLDIVKGVSLTGEFGGEIEGSSVGVYFQGTAIAPIQHQQVTFVSQVLASATGVVLGGSMQAANALFFDVGTTKFRISELGIVIGIDDEGVPSVGFAAAFDINQVNVSAAVFIDSVNPAQSLFAAALSGFSLLDIATCIANQPVQATTNQFGGMTNNTIPSYFAPVLSQFKLSGTKTFMVADTSQTLQSALDNGDLVTVAKAFANSVYQIALPATHDQVLLDVNTPGMIWYITDLNTRLHYSLRSIMSSIQVTLEPQMYFAPQDSSIGGLTFPQGFSVHGKLDLLLLHAEVDIDVHSTGLLAEIDVEPIVLWNANFFALTGSAGNAGPHVSIATMSQPNLTDPRLAKPHIVISGEIKVLGADLSSTYLVASASGITIQVTAQAQPWLGLSLSGNVGNSANMSLGGSITIGINDTFDLGPLGKVSLPSATGSLNMALSNNVASAHLQISFTFYTWAISFGVDLDVHVGALTSVNSLKQLLHTPILNALTQKMLADVEGWINWTASTAKQLEQAIAAQMKAAGRDAVEIAVATGQHELVVLQQIGGALARAYNLAAKDGVLAMQRAKLTAQQIGSALHNGYNLASADAAKAMHHANVAAADIAGALQSAYGSSANDAATAMRTAGIATNDIAASIKSIYNLSVSDMSSLLKNALGVNQNDLQGVLGSAGYAANDIKNFFNSLGSTFSGWFSKI